MVIVPLDLGLVAEDKPTELSCSNFVLFNRINSGSSDFFIDPLRFGVGEHTLDVTIETEFGQVLNVPTLMFVYEG